MDSVMLDLLPHITGFLEKPDKCPAFAVPAAYAGSKVADLKTAGFHAKVLGCAAGQHMFDAVVIRLKADRRASLDAALTIVFGDADREKLQALLCLVPKLGTFFFPMVTPAEVKVSIYDQRDPLETPKEEKLRHLAIAEYDQALRSLARVSGLKVHFHAEGGGIKPPFPVVEGEVHILTNAQPPGQIGVRYVPLAFGLKVHEEGLSVLGNGPTKGRGVVVKDDLGEPLVQILGNTWYLLLPTLSHFNWQTSRLIFEKLLTLAWRGSREAAKLKAPKPATRKTFAETVSKWTDDLPELIRADVKNLDRKIEDAQRDLADLTRRKKESLALLESFGKSSFAQEARARAPKDFAAIEKDPFVERVIFSDDGFHVETKPLVVEEDGKRYDIGAFTLRIAKRGTVSVWSETPTHKGGIPHPHIAKDGGPCFGNATRAIAEAAGEQRYADAVRYVLRWLTEGYTKALAAVKLHEWPFVGESAEHYETRYLAEKALADAANGPAPSGPADGFIAAALQLVKEIETKEADGASDVPAGGPAPQEEEAANAADA